MSIQFHGSDMKLELPQSHPSSSSSTYNYAYAYIISSPSDAVDGPKADAMAMNMKEFTRSTMADSGSWEENIPVAQPWPESRPTFRTNESSPSSAIEEGEDEDDIDAQLKVVLESLRDLYRECEILFRKVFFKNQQKNEGRVDPKSKISLELGKKRVSRILKETKWNQTKAGMLQRSLSVDSPRTPLGRFKVKTLDLGGGGGGGPYDMKGLTKDD